MVKTSAGGPSNFETTALRTVVQHGCMYVGNVGNSTVVFGKYNQKYGKNVWKIQPKIWEK